MFFLFFNLFLLVVFYLFSPYFFNILIKLWTSCYKNITTKSWNNCDCWDCDLSSLLQNHETIVTAEIVIKLWCLRVMARLWWRTAWWWEDNDKMMTQGWVRAMVDGEVNIKGDNMVRPDAFDGCLHQRILKQQQLQGIMATMIWIGDNIKEECHWDNMARPDAFYWVSRSANT